MQQSQLEKIFAYQLKAFAFPTPECEFVFKNGRRWRFDFAWPERLIAVEIEGGSWINGAHGRGKHFESDCEKYAEATILGWRVLRFTTNMVRDGRAIQVTQRAFAELQP